MNQVITTKVILPKHSGVSWRFTVNLNQVIDEELRLRKEIHPNGCVMDFYKFLYRVEGEIDQERAAFIIFDSVYKGIITPGETGKPTEWEIRAKQVVMQLEKGVTGNYHIQGAVELWKPQVGGVVACLPKRSIKLGLPWKFFMNDAPWHCQMNYCTKKDTAISIARHIIFENPYFVG